MVTLTYKDVDGWKPGHIAKWIQCVRQWLARRGFPMRYVWVAELQKRGAPHYHCVVWVPKCLQLPKSDKRGWWPHGSSNTIEARNGIGYITKYVSKVCSKVGFPHGMRIHGVGGLTEEGRRVVRWWNMPAAIRNAAGEGADLVRRVGGGILDRATGAVWLADWAMCAVGTVLEVVGGERRVTKRHLVLSRKWAIDSEMNRATERDILSCRWQNETELANIERAAAVEMLTFCDRIRYFERFADDGASVQAVHAYRLAGGF